MGLQCQRLIYLAPCPELCGWIGLLKTWGHKGQTTPLCYCACSQIILDFDHNKFSTLVYLFPYIAQWGAYFLFKFNFFLTFVIVRFLNLIQLTRCRILPHCDLDLHFPDQREGNFSFLCKLICLLFCFWQFVFTSFLKILGIIQNYSKHVHIWWFSKHILNILIKVFLKTTKYELVFI